MSILTKTNAVELATYYETGWGAERLSEVPYRSVNNATRHKLLFRMWQINDSDLQRAISITIRQLNSMEEKEC